MLEVWQEFWKSLQGIERAFGGGVQSLEGGVKNPRMIVACIIIFFMSVTNVRRHHRPDDLYLSIDAPLSLYAVKTVPSPQQYDVFPHPDLMLQTWILENHVLNTSHFIVVPQSRNILSYSSLRFFVPSSFRASIPYSVMRHSKGRARGFTSIFCWLLLASSFIS